MTIDSALSLRVFGEDITVAGREEARKKSEAIVEAAPEGDSQAFPDENVSEAKQLGGHATGAQVAGTQESVPQTHDAGQRRLTTSVEALRLMFWNDTSLWFGAGIKPNSAAEEQDRA